MTEEEWKNLKVGDVLLTEKKKLRKVLEILKDSVVLLSWSTNIGEPLHTNGGFSRVEFKDRYGHYFKKVKNTKLARKMYPNAELEDGWLKVML
jgi:hypothetical protein